MNAIAILGRLIQTLPTGLLGPGLMVKGFREQTPYAFSVVIEMSARIQISQQILTHMKFLGQSFPRAAIGKLSLGKSFMPSILAGSLRTPRHVVFLDSYIFQRGAIVRGELPPGFVADVIRTGQLLRLRVCAQRLLGIVSELPVDLPGREMRPVENDLQPDPGGRSLLGGQGPLQRHGGVDGLRDQVGVERRTRQTREREADQNAFYGTRRSSGQLGLPRESRFSTRLRTLPTFLTAFLTAGADRSVFFAAYRSSSSWLATTLARSCLRPRAVFFAVAIVDSSSLNWTEATQQGSIGSGTIGRLILAASCNWPVRPQRSN